MTVKRSLSLGPFLFQITDDFEVRATRDGAYAGGVQFPTSTAYQIEVVWPGERGRGADYFQHRFRHGRPTRRDLVYAAFVGIRQIMAQYRAEQFALRED